MESVAAALLRERAMRLSATNKEKVCAKRGFIRLSDGSEVPEEALAEKAGITVRTLRRRATVCNDYDFLVREKQTGGHAKTYTIPDGSEVTIRGVMLKTGLSHTGARHRISTCQTLDELMAPSELASEPSAESAEHAAIAA